jgi:putative nucleotidyltransferase with HDIG domain
VVPRDIRLYDEYLFLLIRRVNMNSELQQELNIFYNEYNKYDSNLYGVHSKLDHTFRVVNYARDIAVLEGLTYADFLEATRCALFHDIARFKQFATYNTFIDSLSFDHGDEGYNILKEAGYEDEIVLLSTKYHNKKDVPSELPDRTKLFCNITRDADKLDIMATQGLTCEDETFILPEEAIQSIKNHTLVLNNERYEKMDSYNILRCIAFIFDLNFKRSFEVIKEFNIISNKFNTLLNRASDEQKIILNELQDICNKYLDERISD